MKDSIISRAGKGGMYILNFCSSRSEENTSSLEEARAETIAYPVQGKLVCTFPTSVFPLRGRHFFTRKKPAQERQ
jgi:hypothetical protein